MYPLTPPHTPATPATVTQSRTQLRQIQTHIIPNRTLVNPESESPELLSLPPPLHSIPEFDLDGITTHQVKPEGDEVDMEKEADRGIWRPGMTPEEKVVRREWLAQDRGRRGLRIVIVTGERHISVVGSILI
jgi:hypothetical protein